MICGNMCKDYRDECIVMTADAAISTVARLFVESIHKEPSNKVQSCITTSVNC